MAKESNERRVIITILLTSTLLTMLGIAGVLRGAYDLSLAPLPEDVRELYEPEAQVSDAEIQLLEAQVSNPYRRPMAAANVVVSSLVAPSSGAIAALTVAGVILLAGLPTRTATGCRRATELRST